LHVLRHVATCKVGGDDGANERRGAEAAAEEDMSDAVTATDQLRGLCEVLHDVVESRARQVLALELTCRHVYMFIRHNGQKANKQVRQ